MSRGAEDSNHITSHGSVGWTAVAKSSSNPIASSVAIPTSVQRFFNPDNLVLTTSRPLLSEFECGELRKEYEAQQVELQKQKGFGGAYSDLGFDQSAGARSNDSHLHVYAMIDTRCICRIATDLGKPEATCAECNRSSISKSCRKCCRSSCAFKPINQV